MRWQAATWEPASGRHGIHYHQPGDIRDFQPQADVTHRRQKKFQGGDEPDPDLFGHRCVGAGNFMGMVPGIDRQGGAEQPGGQVDQAGPQKKYFHLNNVYPRYILKTWIRYT